MYVDVCVRVRMYIYVYLINIIRNVIYLIKTVSNCNRIHMSKCVGNVFDRNCFRSGLCSIQIMSDRDSIIASKLFPIEIALSNRDCMSNQDCIRMDIVSV